MGPWLPISISVISITLVSRGSYCTACRCARPVYRRAVRRQRRVSRPMQVLLPLQPLEQIRCRYSGARRWVFAVTAVRRSSFFIYWGGPHSYYSCSLAVLSTWSCPLVRFFVWFYGLLSSMSSHAFLFCSSLWAKACSDHLHDI